MRVADDQRIEGLVSYVQGNRLFGFPDYITARIVPVGIEDGSQGSTLVIFSRFRLGRSDLGVNEQRVTAWLDELERVLD